MKVMDIVAEGIDNHGLAKSRKERDQMVIDLLQKKVTPRGLRKEAGK